MRVAQPSTEGDHFTEGEPDLEPPEELAVGELDDEAVLEEELDNEDVLEQDVEETVLEETLEDLVRAENGDDDEYVMAVGITDTGIVEGSEDLEEFGDLEVEDIEDLEESLDMVLRLRLASDDGAGAEYGLDLQDWTARDGADRDGGEPSLRVTAWAGALSPPPVAPEFVCRSCFFVRTLTLLADADTLTCRDCTP